MTPQKPPFAIVKLCKLCVKYGIFKNLRNANSKRTGTIYKFAQALDRYKLKTCISMVGYSQV